MPKTLRILRIIARMNVGGPAIQIAGIAKHIDTSKYETLLLAGYCETNETDYLDQTTIACDLMRIEGLGRSIKIKSDLIALISIIKVIWRFKPHIIHTHTAKAGMLGRVASLISFWPSKRIHTFHGHVLKGYFSERTSRILIFIEKTLGLFTHKIVVVGKNVGHDLVNLGVTRPSKIVSIPSGIEEPNFPPMGWARQTFGLDQSTIIGAFIGRIEPIKRFDRFIECVDLINRQGVNCLFIVAGDGSLRERYEKICLSRNLPVKFLGWITEVETVIAACDFTILTSDNEGIPMAFIQSAFAAKPIVSTNVGSVEEIVLDNKTGLLGKSTGEDLAAKCIELIQDPLLRKNLGAGASLHANLNFTVRRLTKDHEELYDLVSRL